MMLALLFGLTLLVVLLPMLPALLEWARPSDIEPLHIDVDDALDPPCLARNFGCRLQQVLASGQPRLGNTVIERLWTSTTAAQWPLAHHEKSAAKTQRLWHVQGDAQLPAGVTFSAEVSASGTLVTAPGAVHRALLAGSELLLAADNTVLRWAHAGRVTVGPGARLLGQVSAETEIVLIGGASFALLHAPLLRFGTAAPLPQSIDGACGVFQIGLPDGVAWDAGGERAVSAGPLEVGSHRAWRGDLVCHGALTLGNGCNAHGSIKSHDRLQLGSHCSIGGSLVAVGPATLAEGCVVRGSVISESLVVIASGCVVGAPGHPASVSAPRIEIAEGVTVHGTVWAGAHGGRLVSASGAAATPATSVDAAVVAASARVVAA